MEKTKKVLKIFTIFQYEEEQEYLRQMHKSGWKLVKVTGLGMYHFVACTPEDVVYQLDYNKDGIANKAEYVQMFADCNWEYLFDFVGYSYFRKPVSQMQGEEAIFCDAESRFDMMKRVCMGRLLPLLIVFCCIVIPQLSGIHGGSGQAHLVLQVLIDILFVLYVCIFGVCGIQLYKYKKKIQP